MTGRLRCYSFHSVKGGVGKSALSTITALAAADAGLTTYLVDMDLTGTSLADVLPLTPPELRETDGALDLLEPPAGFCDERTAAERIARRQEDLSGQGPVGVPYLNDYLLFATPDWEEGRDIDPRSLSWRLTGAPDVLRVLPSSALPRDLERILPVVLDEEHGGFLEARLEYLLDALVPDDGETVVVFDTPPTIPGLSRAVLSLAIRLGYGEKRPLSEDCEPPPDKLSRADVSWTAFVVSTPDLQDMRAAARWLDLLRGDEREVVGWLINFAPSSENNREAWLRDALSLGRPRGPDLAQDPGMISRDVLSEVLLADVVWVEQEDVLRIFRDVRAPHAPLDWLARLQRKP